VAQLSCSLKVIFDDSGKDGWSHNYITVSTNGQQLPFVDRHGVKTSLGSLPYGQQDFFIIKNVTDGVTLTITYHPAGTYQSENSWYIFYDYDDSPILSQGVGNATQLSNQLTVRCCCIPAKVTGLEVNLKKETPYYADLTWNVVEDALYYRLTGARGNSNQFQLLGEYNSTRATLFVLPSTTYRYQVTALGNFSWGEPSDSVSITTYHYTACSLSVAVYDNLDDILSDPAYLAITIGDGLALYKNFDSKSYTDQIQIPTKGAWTVTTEIIGERDTSDLEYIIRKKS